MPAALPALRVTAHDRLVACSTAASAESRRPRRVDLGRTHRSDHGRQQSFAVEGEIGANAIVWWHFLCRRSEFMHRRGALAMLGGALVLGGALGARAQPAAKVRRIGFLEPGVGAPPAELQQLCATVRALGWIEGQNLVVEYRRAGDRPELLRLYAEELVRLNVELIATTGTAAAIVAKNATTRIPIVMITAGDPVRAGLVASLARPGGNITGFSVVSPELDAKRLGLLREVSPAAQRIGAIVNPTNPYTEIARDGSERLFRSVGIEPIIVEVAAASELENAVAEVARRGAQALIVVDDPIFYSNRVVLMRAALRHALPTIVPRGYLEDGGLLSLSFDSAENDRVFAYFVDKILRGAKPADLPVQQPSRFWLSINLKTAKALGLTIPQSLLLRADEVIQ
jgi:putative tryptophan/tyrosine transport system substrate-binding protein